MNTEALVEVRGLEKEFSRTKVLKGINLRFLRGEAHGLLGENGAGKSTLIKILTGVYAASAGQILIDNVRARGNDGIDHIVSDQVDERLFQPSADQRPGQAQDDAAFLIAQHALVDPGGTRQIAGRVSHVLHGIDESANIVPLDIDVFDRVIE